MNLNHSALSKSDRPRWHTTAAPGDSRIPRRRGRASQNHYFAHTFVHYFAHTFTGWGRVESRPQYRM
jgi:hypothetical protein